MASLDGEPNFVLKPITAQERALLPESTPVVMLPRDLNMSGGMGGTGAPAATGGTAQSVAVRLEGSFNGTLTVLVNCPSGAAGKASAGSGLAGTGLNQFASLDNSLAATQFGDISSASVGAVSSTSNGCAALLVLGVVLMLMLLAAGGTMASFSSHPGGSSLAVTGAPSMPAQALPMGAVYVNRAQAPFQSYTQAQAAPVALSATNAQGAYCLPCALQAVQPAANVPASGPAAAVMTAPVPASGANCLRNPACPGNCPVAPFCANHLAIKGVCNPTTGAHNYYFPGQAGYVESQVGLYVGDAYFCSFSAAAGAGFTLAP